MEKIIDLMTTNYYKTLKIIADSQVLSSEGVMFAPITQVEIADKLNISKITVNSIFKKLQEENLVVPYENKKGMYCLTDKAKTIVDTINNMRED